MNAIKTTQYIVQILGNSEDITNIVPLNSIYPLNAIEGATFPFIAIIRNSVTPKYCKDGLYQDEVSVSIVAVAETYAQSVEIADKVRTLMEYKQYIADDGVRISVMTCDGCYEGIYNKAYIQQVDFTLKIDAKLVN